MRNSKYTCVLRLEPILNLNPPLYSQVLKSFDFQS